MILHTDALVIGAGPSGSATAILLARAGWKVVLVEQDAYPRRKVCGECITAGALALLDELGIGTGVQAHAGPELRRIGWMSEAVTLIADAPVCKEGPYRYGRALRRDFLDRLLAEQAFTEGVFVMQPARVLAVSGAPGSFRCRIAAARLPEQQSVLARVVIDAHGSWQRGPRESHGEQASARTPRRSSDLFAFKAVFEHTRLDPGILPVIAVAGGYGGMVIADHGQATVACCLRRDSLAACRSASQRASAGEAVEEFLRHRCLGVRRALDGAVRLGPWLTVGPLQPGMHHHEDDGLFRVGNAAGETHPLIGEGIAMALQSAALLVEVIADQSPATITIRLHSQLQRRYAAAWRRAFLRRLQVGSVYAQIAMRPGPASAACAMLARWPSLLTRAAKLAGKAREFNPGSLPRGSST
jgi:flavin-dependent dehydrogenase